ncbi:hypothetical protein FOA43_004183 [Brettanomyces nanus]|uniref:PQ-loop-domain-containing protein n=1 Tax=Eeniella nana TaxID=13502 RepID=A0A875SB62_EENNA|nr:uncharacterized protein FOA43_004183 [Brettanomyces nanus]QPG76789.1 hypothetical protein FOA43_004183 [Brettanomyces nanus]
MTLLWCLCTPFFAVYFVSEDASIPIQLQPHMFGILCWIVYIQVMLYPPVSRPKKQIIIRAGGFILFWAAVEIASVIPLRKLYMDRGVTWPILIYGIIASILLALGLIPPYFELYKRQGRVIGINFIFLATDLSGAIFSLASLAVDPANFDIMGAIIYSICAFLEIGIFASHLVWCCRFKWFANGSSEEDVESKLDTVDATKSSTIPVEDTEIDCLSEEAKDF